MNRETLDECDVRIALGIDHGRILLVGGLDYVGDPVNTASAGELRPARQRLTTQAGDASSAMAVAR